MTLSSRKHHARAESSFTVLYGIPLILLFVAAICNGQTVNATLQGTITDKTGARVSGVTVEATSVDTGIAAKSTTDSLGDYSFPSLKPGNYTLRIQKEGFNTTELSAIPLSVAQSARVNAELVMGRVSTSVQVNETTPIVNTTSDSISSVIGEQQIQDLPLSLRRFGALATLAAGIVDTTVPGNSTSSQGSSPFYSTFSETLYSANGLRPGSNLVTIDGMMSRNLLGGGFGVQPPPEAIKEFNLQTNAYSTVFGETAGSTLNVVTKSGTNSWHGDAWEFFQNDALNARNYFSTTRPELRRNQFGFALGGPIRKNKTFVFGTYEGTRQINGQTLGALVPTAAEKSGDFSSFLTGQTTNLCGAGGPTNLTFDTGQLFQPATESIATCPSGSANAGSTVLIGSPVPGNSITNIDPIAQKILADYPAPNRSGFPNFINSSPATRNDDQVFFRADHTISAKDSLFGHYIIANTHEINNNLAGSPLTNFSAYLNFRGQHATGEWIHIFDSSLLNELRIGWQRNYDFESCVGCPRAGGTIAGFGIQGVTAISPQNEQYPLFGFNNFAAWGDSEYIPDVDADSAEMYEDNLSWIHGRHTITAGANITYWQDPLQEGPLSPAGNFSFNGQYSSLAGQIPGVGGISDLADFEFGTPNFGQHTSTFQNVHAYNGRFWSFYGQDDISVNPNLTVNLGLRWEWHVPPLEKNGNSTTFYPTGPAFSGPGNGVLITALPDAQNDALCTQNPSLISLTGQCLVASSSLRAQLGFTGRKRKAVQLDSPQKFAPRIGLTWRPLGSDKFVIHAGAGIFADIPMLNPFLSPGTNSPTTSLTPSYHYAFGSPPPLVNGAPATIETGFALGTLINISNSTSLLNAAPNYRMPEVGEWSLGVESQLAANWSLAVYYVGNGAWHLDNLHNSFNQPAPGVGNPQPRRPYPDFSGFVFYDTTDVNSNYNGLQATLKKRLSSGLSLLASYTFAKSMWETGGDDTPGGEERAQDDNNIHANWGRSPFDQTHTFAFNSVWELPVGKGRHYLNQSGIAAAVLGGWEGSGIVHFATGQPFTVGSAQDFSNSLSTSPRPDRICNGSGQKTVSNFFNTACFPTTSLATALANGTPRFGDSGTDILDGPGYKDWDLSLLKRIAIPEGARVEFRAEFFNAFNNVNFGPPNTTVGTGTVAQISSAGSSRAIQLALKVSF